MRDPRAGERLSLGSVIEDLIAGLVAAALIAYLVYALVRPDKF
jgi:K+-transporting ATPase KdpF subunit